jgi:hypothetical protein
MPLKGGMFRLAWCKRYGRPLNEYERIVQSPATAYEPAQPRPYRRQGERAALIQNLKPH